MPVCVSPLTARSPQNYYLRWFATDFFNTGLR